MNYSDVIESNLWKYKADPLDEYYLAIEDAMVEYKANPSAGVREMMKDEGHIRECEDPNCNDPLLFDNKPIDLDGLFSKFFQCPTNITAKNFLQALKDYKLKNPNGKNPFDSL